MALPREIEKWQNQVNKDDPKTICTPTIIPFFEQGRMQSDCQ